MREWKTRKNIENIETPETRTIEIPSFHHCWLIAQFEALGKCCCPCDWDLCSVRYGADGALKTKGPRPNSPPRPAQWPGAGRLFFHHPPLPPSGPPPRSRPRTAPRRLNFPLHGPAFSVIPGCSLYLFSIFLYTCPLISKILHVLLLTSMYPGLTLLKGLSWYPSSIPFFT